MVAQGPEAKLSESKHVLTLKQLEQDWLDSYREGDADKMGKILADDFIGRWANGSTQTKDEHEWPHYIGSEQVRNFRFEGDRLILSLEETPPNGERRRCQITWQRVSSTSYAAQGR